MAKKQISNYKFVPSPSYPAFGLYPKTVALLIANRTFLQEEASAYIAQQIASNLLNTGSIYYNYQYTSTRITKCKRDIGYGIDAFIYDLTYGGNSLTYQVASSYYLAGVSQLQNPLIEIDVKNWLRAKITTNILTNTTYTRLNTVATQTTISGNAAESGGVSIVTTLANNIISVITNGYSSLPTLVIPSPQNGGLLTNTVSILNANKIFMQEEVIAFIQYNINNNIAPYISYTYNADKCRRDVSYVIEGYITDLAHGGNRQTVFNARKYFENGIPQVDGDRTPEITAHTFLQNLILSYILTNTASSPYQTVVSQTILGVTQSPGTPARITELSNFIINVITQGLPAVPTVISNRAYIKIPGQYKLKDFLLITNTSRNVVLYSFHDSSVSGEVTYWEEYDSDFPGALYGNDKITTLTLNVDTTGMMMTDHIQIFVEGKEQLVRMNSIATDAMERMKVGIPQSMLDADFEYGLQPTKWQALALMRGYPSIYEIPGSDISTTSVTTDASTGNTGGAGASQITVTTQNSHGLAVNDPFTIKALANSITGFSRAEGSFLVATVPTVNSFTYYAKSKVGTSNGQVLSTTYTQLRKAGFYTGASIGSPTFAVYSNGSTGSITTSLITPVGIDVIGFSGTPPPIGAPLSGTGINSGTQVTAVVGSGGTAATTTLSAGASIGDTSITVTSTTGIAAGLVFDRGDGQAVTVTDITGNIVKLGGALTSNISGTTQTYAGLSPTSTTGSGATVSITRTAGVYSVAVTGGGTGFSVNDTLTVTGSNLGGVNTTNDATITVATAAAKNLVAFFDPASLVGGSGYSTATGVATTGGTGSGLTVNIAIAGGGGTAIFSCQVNNGGSGYTVGDVITITGGNGAGRITVNQLTLGGAILTATVAGTPITAPTKNFISAFTMNDLTTGSIASGNTGLTYSAIATIQVVFAGAHGFIPGDTITVQISSGDTNAQLAAGPFFVEQVPDVLTLRYTARAAGTIANTLAGVIYGRPDSFFVHRPFDGGVQLGTASPSHGATAIRMSKKYIRYQSGKGVAYNTGALFAPSYNLRSISATGTAVGSVITVVTDDTDHGCQVGGIIQIIGVVTSGYNNLYTVTDIRDERTLSVQAIQQLGSTTGVLGNPCQMSIRNWHGATIRSGIFDDQNGMFWQYDGIRMAVVKRSSTFLLAGTISILSNSNAVSGSSTRFTQQVAAGDRIVIKGMTHVVSQIINDTSMTVTPDFRGVFDLTNVKAAKVIDLVVPQEWWNIDPLNGSGQSGYNIDVTKMQMIGIQHTWYGAGFIDFMLRGPDGNYAFAHRFRNSNYNTEAYMRSGNQPVRYEVINEGARDQLSAAIDNVQTTIPLKNAYWFPNNGTVIIDSELIRFTGNNGTSLTGCVRSAQLTQFAGGAQRNFTGTGATTHVINSGVILVSNTITPNISHWGSAFMIDGQFDSDRGYIFNYSATAITASLDKTTAFLIRLAPSVSNAQTGDLGERELLNRAQMLLSNISITSDSVTGGGAIVVEGVFNPGNYPTDPTKITWNGLNNQAGGGQPSFAQVAAGGSVTWGGSVYTNTSTVQGAFTTTLTAKSFAPATNTLTAVSFSSISQTAVAQSFASGTSVTYNRAFDTTRTDFLIPQSTYTAFQTTLQAGDTLSVPTYLTSSQKIVSVTPNYITLASVAYARIVMTAVPNANSAAAASNGAQNVPGVSITSSLATTYNTAISTSRTDFLVTQTQYAGSTIATQDILSATTYLINSQGISSITPNYCTIQNVAYARIQMTSAGTATSAINSGNNVTVTATSAATATYGSALSTSRADFLITDASYAGSGIAVGDTLSIATYLTAGQTINSIVTGFITISSVSYTRIVMSAVANATSTTGGGNDQTVTATAAGTQANYAKTNYLFFTSTTWLAAGVIIGTKIATSYTNFPAGTSVAGITTRTFGATTVYRASFTQTSNATIAAAATVTWQFGSLYALPGEQVFSFVNNPGNTDTLDLNSLKEMTSTAIGGRGTFPNGPDVLAINVYKVSGTSTPCNIILRWGEAQA